MRRSKLDLLPLVDIILILLFAFSINLRKKEEGAQKAHQRQLSAAKQQIQALRQQRDRHHQKARSLAQDRAQMDADMRNLQSLVLRLQQTMERLQARQGELQRLRETTRKQLQAMGRELQTTQKQRASLEQDKQRLERLRVRLERALRQAKQDLARKQKQLLVLQEMYRKEREEARSLAAKLTRADEERKRLEDQLRAADARYRIASMEARELAVQLARLKEQLASKEAALRVAHSELQAIRTQQAKEQSRQRALALAHGVLEQENLRLRSRIKALEARLAKSILLEDRLSQRDKSQQASQRALERLQQELASLREQITMLQRQNESLRTQVLLAQREEEKQQKHQKTLQSRFEETQRARFQAEALAAQRDKELSALREEQKRLRLSVERYAVNKVRSDAQHTQLKQQIQTGESQRAQLLRERKLLEDRQKEMQAALASYKIFGHHEAREQMGIVKGMRIFFPVIFVYVKNDRILGYKRLHALRMTPFGEPIELSRRVSGSNRLMYRGKVEVGFRAFARLEKRLPTEVSNSTEVIYVIVFDAQCSLAVTQGLEDEHQRYYSEMRVIWQL